MTCYVCGKKRISGFYTCNNCGIPLCQECVLANVCCDECVETINSINDRTKEVDEMRELADYLDLDDKS